MNSSTVLIFFVLGFALVNCKKSKSDPCTSNLNLIAEYGLQVPEPSGLSLHENGNLICVSDQTSMAYLIGTTGITSESHPIQGADLEGIHYSIDDKRIYYVDESTGLLHAADSILAEITSWPIIAPDGNKGLEGCTMDPDSGIIYLLKERSPGTLIRFDLDNETTESFPLDFSSDYSGIAFNQQSGMLYIISDASQSLSICTTEGIEVARYGLCIEKAEGIALDVDLGRIYIVSDRMEKLYVFRTP